MDINQTYIALGKKLLNEGLFRKTRNGVTLGIFGASMTHDMGDGFPILSIRNIYTKGIVGEFKSFIEDADTIAKFEANGCNYWKLWAEKDGSIKLDYPPRKQLDYVIDLLKNEPTSRRILIDLWNPDNRGKLSLDPCHTQYQFYVREGAYLDMIWTQRSVDYAVGMPSDLILAALYVEYICSKVEGLTPGRITYNLGDIHLYEEHIDGFKVLMKNESKFEPVDYTFKDFKLTLVDYSPEASVKFLLKA